jgi:beta-lactamase superfamily II metal-dependent hydrolase
MPLVKAHAVGNGDMTYIRHGSDNFTIVDCVISEDNKDALINELKGQSADKGVTRFISTHPDEDHFLGLDLLDDEMPILNFYVVQNKAVKDIETTSFKRYCRLRDGDKAFYISKECQRKWMNQSSDERRTSGIQILWPDTSTPIFKNALSDANAGIAYNNLSPVIRYSIEDGPSFMWLGDLETQFMEDIGSFIDLPKTSIVFASHHGRKSGKVPDSWLERLRPEIIIIGEAPSRHLHYYTGYSTLTQNRTGDITMDCAGNGKVHVYVSNENYEKREWLADEWQDTFPNYIGTLTVS